MISGCRRITWLEPTGPGKLSGRDEERVHDLTLYPGSGIRLAKKFTGKQYRPRADSLLAETTRLIHRFHLQAKKSLGQHFLIDEEVLHLIAATAGLTTSDIVVEVGPGLGVLTRELARQAGKVLAIELDGKLAHLLQDSLAGCGNVTIINKDVLEVEPGALLQSAVPSAISRPPYKVVANLPYYITAMTLRHFLESPVKPQLIVVMVQKEVAETIAAEPGDMSLLSVSVQFYGKPAIVSKVPASCFYPEPEVDSAILRIDVYAQPPVAVDEESFFDLVRAGFSAPRKQLHNALSQRLCLPQTEVQSFLEEAGIMPQRRAQTLTLEEWAKLWRIYTESKGKHADR